MLTILAGPDFFGDTLSTPPPEQQFTTAAGRFCDRSVAALECRCNPSFI